MTYLKQMTITEKDLQKHRKLMTDYVYAIVMPRLLDIKGISPDQALEEFREHQHNLLKKYGYTPASKYYIDFNGNIIER